MTPKILELVPWSALMPHGPQLTLIILSVVAFIVALRFVFKECRRRQDEIPFYAFVGGGLIVIYEPLGDILASVFYPVHGQIGWIDLFGREIPLFIGITYFSYMSVPAIYFLKKVDEGMTKALLWKLYGLSVLMAVGIEVFGVSLGAWVYYGPHPFVVLGVPLWCPITYSGFLITISIGLHAMATQLERRHHWLVMFGVPLFMAGGHCALALPAAAAMFTTQNPVFIWAGGFASIALTMLLVYVAGILYCIKPSAAQSNHK